MRSTLRWCSAVSSAQRSSASLWARCARVMGAEGKGGVGQRLGVAQTLLAGKSAHTARVHALQLRLVGGVLRTYGNGGARQQSGTVRSLKAAHAKGCSAQRLRSGDRAWMRRQQSFFTAMPTLRTAVHTWSQDEARAHMGGRKRKRQCLWVAQPPHKNARTLSANRAVTDVPLRTGKAAAECQSLHTHTHTHTHIFARTHTHTCTDASAISVASARLCAVATSDRASASCCCCSRRSAVHAHITPCACARSAVTVSPDPRAVGGCAW